MDMEGQRASAGWIHMSHLTHHPLKIILKPQRVEEMQAEQLAATQTVII